MRVHSDQLQLSATDLAHHLACKHLTQLNLAVANGASKPQHWNDPRLEALWERGFEHEEAYVRHLGAQGVEVVDLRDEDAASSLEERTRLAMQAGAGAIIQAGLAHGRWRGRADVLLRVETASALGPWSYEVVDTKLAAETKATTVLQLCLYSEMVGEIQGRLPGRMHVVRPGVDFVPETFRLARYLAYHLHIKRQLEASVAERAAAATYPEPCAHCAICDWRWVCNEKRHADDHLSLVADIRRRQRVELEERELPTMTQLAALEVPLPWRPRRGSRAAMERVREQARVQVEARDTAQPVFEVLPPGDEHGFRLLPPPSPGDLFFDLEGDRFAGNGGLEYLFAYCTRPAEDEAGIGRGDASGDGAAGAEPAYWHRWALDPAAEKQAFEALIASLTERWRRYPDFHIYHFSPYDSAALKRLMGRYATCEEELDQLLRGERFVDLMRVTKRAVRCGIESYSLKELEAFSGFVRTVELEEAARHLRRAQRGIELGEPELLDAATRQGVVGYNRDDCLSLIALQDWLEAQRAREVEAGEEIPRPELKEVTPDEEPNEKALGIAALVARLTDGVPVVADERTPEQHACWLLAQLLEYHRREKKATWWEFFALQKETEENLFELRTGVAGLEFVDRIGGSARCPVDRYRYPAQDTRLKVDSEFHDGENKVGSAIVAWDVGARTVDIKKLEVAKDHHPRSGFAFNDVRADAIVDSLVTLGQSVDAHGLAAEGPYLTATNLLLRRRPVATPGGAPGPCQQEYESSLAAAKRWAISLGTNVLPIQGPPGSGKTYTGARMVVRLVNEGKKVGVTANSHKVIRNFMNEVESAAAEEGITVRCGQKVKKSAEEHPTISLYRNNQATDAALLSGEIDVLGGTSWLWARPELADAVDVLFVDEAGQLALANVLACAQAAKSLVLLGDPQQLEQPQQGSHPEGCAVSALEYLLDQEPTLAADQGLFLAETYRLHPAICEFSSQAFYDGRLESRPGLEYQAILGPHLGSGSGLYFLPVDHEGNQSSSPEEVEAIGALIEALTDGTSTWRDENQEATVLSRDDILVIAPYNDQVQALSERLDGVRVGTVDKFQGREAPVVIYSLATSSPEDAPRGMEFLYSPSRLNVATSRARAACVLVGSPRVFEPECGTPRQMELANGFCWYLDLAERLEG